MMRGRGVKHGSVLALPVVVTRDHLVPVTVEDYARSLKKAPT
jgi:hypothetical protein